MCKTTSEIEYCPDTERERESQLRESTKTTENNIQEHALLCSIIETCQNLAFGGAKIGLLTSPQEIQNGGPSGKSQKMATIGSVAFGSIWCFPVFHCFSDVLYPEYFSLT